jgi:hypothetical protein
MRTRAKDDRIRRRYRHPLALVGLPEPARDLHNFSDVDRACEKWLTANDSSYTKGCIPNTYIDHEPD